MSESEKVTSRWEDEWRVLRVRLSAPPGNILDREMVAGLEEAVAEVAQVPECALVVFEGAGENFSFGASIQEHRPPAVTDLLGDFHSFLRSLLDLDVPTACLVRGRCLGGGLELAAACDFLFAAEDAELGFPEIRLGVFAPAASALLPHKLGATRAAELLLTGSSLAGADARAMGLATLVFPEPRLEAGFEAWLRATLLKRSSAALRLATRAVRLPWKQRFFEDLAKLEGLYLEQAADLPDAREGIDAFLEKRRPVWSHRP